MSIHHQTEAEMIDRQIQELVTRLDQFNEMVSRDQPNLDAGLIEAAQWVNAARAVVFKYTVRRAA